MLTHTSAAGRELTHPRETNDCTVVALAHVLGVPYAEAHKIMAEAGRRPRHGMRNSEIQKVIDGLKDSGRIVGYDQRVFHSARPMVSQLSPNVVRGYRMYARRPRRKGTTVAQALRAFPRVGRFYLTCTTHAFAYVDGKVLDNLGNAKMRALMSASWEIKLPAVTPQVPEIVAPSLSQSDISAMWERLNKIKF